MLLDILINFAGAGNLSPTFEAQEAAFGRPALNTLGIYPSCTPHSSFNLGPCPASSCP